MIIARCTTNFGWMTKHSHVEKAVFRHIFALYKIYKNFFEKMGKRYCIFIDNVLKYLYVF